MKRSGVTNVTGESHMPSDLAKRGSTYYFRRAVPELLRPYFVTASGAPRAEFMESLGVKDLARAKELARLRGVEVDAMFGEARAKLKAGVPTAAVVRARDATARVRTELFGEQAVIPRPSAPRNVFGIENFKPVGECVVVGEDHQVLAGPPGGRRDQAIGF